MIKFGKTAAVLAALLVCSAGIHDADARRVTVPDPGAAGGNQPELRTPDRHPGGEPARPGRRGHPGGICLVPAGKGR